MSGPSDRRGFLRGLVSLPLIGGGVTLIGNPSAVAGPINENMLDAYSEWLFYERRLLCHERYPDYKEAENQVPCNTGATNFHFYGGPGDYRGMGYQPSTRAALVLAAVGCNWREGGL